MRLGNAAQGGQRGRLRIAGEVYQNSGVDEPSDLQSRSQEVWRAGSTARVDRGGHPGRESRAPWSRPASCLAAEGGVGMARPRPEGCRAAGRPARLAEPALNLVIITLDTTRADHLGAYGSKDVETPALDRLARDGVLFEQAMTTAPLTLPAHASILTGRFPPEHGVRDNGGFFLGAGADDVGGDPRPAGVQDRRVRGGLRARRQVGHQARVSKPTSTTST